jgi:hypothetical protein
MNAISVADIMGVRVATEIPALTAVRPVNGSREKTPWIAYETVEMKNRRRLNCSSKKYDGIIRMYIEAGSYDQANTIAELVKDLLIGHTETGTAYGIKRINLHDETDIAQDDEGDETTYVKSIDFKVTAVKLTA